MTEKELYTYVVKKAVEFGMKPKNMPKGTNHTEDERKELISEDGGNAIVRHSLAKGAYIGLIDAGQTIVEDSFESDGSNDTSGAYTGLSFVVFTQCDEKHGADSQQNYCIISICIGSSSLGDDLDLASKPGFRRSFMNLTNLVDGEDIDYHFVENWSAMESTCPGLKERIDVIETDNNGPLHISLKKYNDKKLLPAACVIKLSEEITEDGIPALDAWLAKYAQWRGWMTKSKLPEGLPKLLAKKRTPAKAQEDIEKEIESILEKHKFIVLQGAPGCGKTWSANKIASNDKTKGLKFSKVFFTQFHAETTYADFVYGIKPKLNSNPLTYEGKAGILLEAIDHAARHTEENVLLIIDEINRANLANVLGPVFYLFEPNEIGRDHELNLGQIKEWEDVESEINKKNIYSVKEGDIKCKALPSNLYVIATMNTADKSLAVVDFALRRRFAWYTLFPQLLDDKKLKGQHFNGNLFDEISTLFESYATDEEMNLQPGHSYFITSAEENKEKDKLNDEMERRLIYEIMPLMKEYFAEGYIQEAKNEFAQLYYRYTHKYMYK